METIKDFRNDLLKRREVQIIIEAVGNPGIAEGRKQILEKFKSDEDKVVVRNVKGKFGRATFMIDAFIYDSKEDKAKVELKTTKKGEGSNEVAAAAPVEEKKVEENIKPEDKTSEVKSEIEVEEKSSEGAEK
jgi:ribosomal protein S24E